MPGFRLGRAGRSSSAVRVVGSDGTGAPGRAALALPPVDQPPAANSQPRTAVCRCGATLAAGAAPHRCTGEAAFDHTRRVGARASLLVARLEAVRALGTLSSEPRPLSAFAQ